MPKIRRLNRPSQLQVNDVGGGGNFGQDAINIRNQANQGLARDVGNAANSVKATIDDHVRQADKADMHKFQTRRQEMENELTLKNQSELNPENVRKNYESHYKSLEKFLAGKDKDGIPHFRYDTGTNEAREYLKSYRPQFDRGAIDLQHRLEKRKNQANREYTKLSAYQNPEAEDSDPKIRAAWDDSVAAGDSTEQEAAIGLERDLKKLSIGKATNRLAGLEKAVEASYKNRYSEELGRDFTEKEIQSNVDSYVAKFTDDINQDLSFSEAEMKDWADKAKRTKGMMRAESMRVQRQEEAAQKKLWADNKKQVLDSYQEDGSSTMSYEELKGLDLEDGVRERFMNRMQKSFADRKKNEKIIEEEKASALDKTMKTTAKEFFKDASTREKVRKKKEEGDRLRKEYNDLYRQASEYDAEKDKSHEEIEDLTFRINSQPSSHSGTLRKLLTARQKSKGASKVDMDFISTQLKEALVLKDEGSDGLWDSRPFDTDILTRSKLYTDVHHYASNLYASEGRDKALDYVQKEVAKIKKNESISSLQKQFTPTLKEEYTKQSEEEIKVIRHKETGEKYRYNVKTGKILGKVQ